MKTTTLLIFTLCFLTSFGQIILENTYTDGFVNRVLLENSGEKYYLLDKATKQVKLYNANHTLWKTISLVTNPNPLDLTLHHLSESKINADNLIEIAYTYYTEIDSEIIYTSKIINENGTVLLSVANASSIELSEISGISNKIIALIDDINSSSHVYSIPSLSLENTYSNGYITRIKLENSGEKYYQLDESINQVKLYNSNHTAWKTITIFPMIDAISITINHLSETKLNDDSKIEVVYSYFNSSFDMEGKISNEDGTSLATFPGVFSLYVNEIDGLPNKLIATFMDINTFLLSGKVYAIPSFTLEKSYAEGIVTRTKLEISGEKYYLLDALSNQVKLYNANHTLWETLMLSSPIGATILGITHLSETKINDDSLIELAYSYDLFNGSETSYTSVIINYNGSIYLSVSGALAIFVSEIIGLQNKLIVPMDGVSETSKVYSLPTATLSVNKELLDTIDIAIYPNPTRDKLTLESQNAPIKHFVITSIVGKIVKEINITSERITIDLSDLSTGIYFVIGQTSDGFVFRKKIIIK